MDRNCGQLNICFLLFLLSCDLRDFSLTNCLYQGETPKDKAEKAHDPELAAYLGNRQHYQMIQREDQETTV